ncbi:ATP-binding protein [Sporolactobacillus terrae]|uniref:ATP-binding protein n=1 Tax=Sporolactobacillus terrae TaxID=269673 RepID=UPI00159B9A01|nr:ATP-binding protein [Sporolactobacillus terrae]
MSGNRNSIDLNFKKMIDQIADAILVLSDETIVYSNRSANQILSFDERTPLSGISIGMFVNPEDMPLLRDALTKITTCQSEKHSLQLNIHSSNNFKLPALINVQLLQACDSLVQLSIHDISARKAAEESMIQSEKLSVIGELSAGIIHEIRNPLTSIKGFLQLMQTSEKLNKDYLEIIMREIEQIEKITTELLYFTKPKSDRFTKINLTTIAQESVRLFETQTLKRNIKMCLEADNADDGHCLYGDKTQLKQVFVNLIKNALEATPKGGTISILLSSTANTEEISIQDTGSGIPEPLIHNLGRSFFTTKATGTGLGLMVTYTIVKNHNGSVHVQSEENKGTTFQLSFPKWKQQDD